jgi:predicted nucleic acid-binding protein
MTLVVDASVATLWVLDQDGSERALALRNEDSLIAPSLIAAEIGSALWKAVRRAETTPKSALIALQSALLPFRQLVPDEELSERAMELAIELNHPIYDCLYLALAERERCGLATADKRLLSAAKKLKHVEVTAL